jgi:hypothetical protein
LPRIIPSHWGDDKRRGSVRSILAAVVVTLALVPSALAANGSPSQAVPLTPDKAATGDTGRQPPDGDGYHREFWSIAFRAGDYVTVDWSEPVGGNTRLYLLPPSTNDNNFTQFESDYRQTDATGHDEFKLTIKSTGTYYFDFRAYETSSYTITVHIRRGIHARDLPSAATLVRPGRWYAGDTSAHVPDSNGDCREFWKVRLTARDRVTLSWAEPRGGSSRLFLLAPGTNNNNFITVESSTEYLSSNSAGRGSVGFVVRRTGFYFLDVRAYSGEAGAYRFKFVVRHRR